MTLYENTLEGGSNTTVITAGNSGGASGDAFTAITAGNWTFSSTQAMRGSLSMRSDGAATAQYFRYNITSTAVAARAYFWLGGLTTADERLIAFFDSTGTTAYAYITCQGTGRLRFGCTGSSSTWTATNQYPTSQWLRLEMYAVAGSTTSNGVASVAIYQGHDTTPYDSMSFSSSALNIGGGGASFGQVRIGKQGANLAQFVYIDDIKVDDAATGLLGPSVLPAFTWAHTVSQG